MQFFCYLGERLDHAQNSYAECVTTAPRENCLKAYLLPRKTMTKLYEMTEDDLKTILTPASQRHVYLSAHSNVQHLTGECQSRLGDAREKMASIT